MASRIMNAQKLAKLNTNFTNSNKSLEQQRQTTSGTTSTTTTTTTTTGTSDSASSSIPSSRSNLTDSSSHLNNLTINSNVSSKIAAFDIINYNSNNESTSTYTSASKPQQQQQQNQYQQPAPLQPSSSSSQINLNETFNEKRSSDSTISSDESSINKTDQESIKELKIINPESTAPHRNNITIIKEKDLLNSSKMLSNYDHTNLTETDLVKMRNKMKNCKMNLPIVLHNNNNNTYSNHHRMNENENSIHHHSISIIPNLYDLSLIKSSNLLNNTTNTTTTTTTTTTITYKSKYFMPILFILFVFTLLPIQYHGENFYVQLKKMQDTCVESAGYFNENQTTILDTIFPYGFSSALSFDNLLLDNDEIRIIDEIKKKKNLNNFTIKYMTLNECKLNNYSSLVNLITIPSTTLTPFVMLKSKSKFLTTNGYTNINSRNDPSENVIVLNRNERNIYYYTTKARKMTVYDLIRLEAFNLTSQRTISLATTTPTMTTTTTTTTTPMNELTSQHWRTILNRKFNLIKQKQFHQMPTSNVILICDDNGYKKSIEQSRKKLNLLSSKSSQLVGSSSNDLTESVTPGGASLDNLDVQTNILTQWNISCKNLSSATVTISYAQMTFLSGEIIGAIFFSMLADYLGRKKVYLTTLYASTIVGSIVSIVQSYKQFVIVRFPIAALTQGCFIVSYVLLFEMILKSKYRNVYCSLFVSTQYFWNIAVAIMSKLIKDWRYMQLAGSLMSSLAIGYPWLIKESFKWLIVREDFVRAERVCRNIFKESGIIARLMKIKSDDQLNDETDINAYWPMVIWQPTFRKIICYFVLLWSVLSLTNFFINEEPIKLVVNNINNYSIQNLILAVFNIGIGFLYAKFGKRFPLGSCMFLGGSFYLASSLISQDLNADWLKLTLNILSKMLLSGALNILMLYVCELFPCEIRCSSFSFFLSIKHLSEMFAIYIFKVNLQSWSIIRIGLAMLCILMCVCAVLLPERNVFAFNLDYLEYLTHSHQFTISSDKSTGKKNKCRVGVIASGELNDSNGGGGVDCDDLDAHSLENDVKNVGYIQTLSTNIQNSNMKTTANQALVVSEIRNVDDCETSILANNLIKKINCENHCKTGKLNPLYEEEQINNFTVNSAIATTTAVLSTTNASQQNARSNANYSKPSLSSSSSLIQTTQQTPNLTNKLNKINAYNEKVQVIQESSTKF